MKVERKCSVWNRKWCEW